MTDSGRKGQTFTLTDASKTGSIAAVSPSATFAAFYDAAVRRQTGARLRATDLHGAYLAWADRAGGCSLSLKELRGLMASRRHRHVKSNRMCFCDATLIEPEHFEIGRGVAALPPDRILRKIDRLASIVAALRDEVAVGLVGERV